MTSTMDFDSWTCPNIVIHLLSCLDLSKFSISQDFPMRYFDFYIISILVFTQKEEWAKQRRFEGNGAHFIRMGLKRVIISVWWRTCCTYGEWLVRSDERWINLTNAHACPPSQHFCSNCASCGPYNCSFPLSRLCCLPVSELSVWKTTCLQAVPIKPETNCINLTYFL